MYRHRSLIVTALITCTAAAQNNDQGSSFWENRSTTLSGGAEFGIPLGEFDFTWGNTTAGLSANIAIPMRTLPLEFGYDFAWGRMGSESSAEQAQGNILGARSGRKVEVSSSIYGHHGLIRLNPLRGKVRPYGEVLLGARNFVTRSTISTADGMASDERDGKWTTSYGWAVGAMYGIGRQIYVEGRVERLFSGEVSYVDPSTIQIAADGTVSYQKLSSRTDALQIQIGVGLRF
ncbi:MAG: hypothetical protein JNM62_12715 [Flavobacteriales bacterium]|nr:hypothetical protein [Flavobacteriales bacterium]